MGDVTVYRVQDRHGHGPWKPGFSIRWIEENGPPLPVAPIEAILEAKRIAKRGEHIGSACLTLDDLNKWITPTEYTRLLGLGYRCVRLDGCRVLADLGHQVIIGRSRPFREGASIVSLFNPRPPTGKRGVT